MVSIISQNYTILISFPNRANLSAISESGSPIFHVWQVQSLTLCKAEKDTKKQCENPCHFSFTETKLFVFTTRKKWKCVTNPKSKRNNKKC